MKYASTMAGVVFLTAAAASGEGAAAERADRLIKSETVRWAKVIKQAGIKGEQL